MKDLAISTIAAGALASAALGLAGAANAAPSRALEREPDREPAAGQRPQRHPEQGWQRATGSVHRQCGPTGPYPLAHRSRCSGRSADHHGHQQNGLHRRHVLTLIGRRTRGAHHGRPSFHAAAQ
jgi:hypothetical protein